MDNFNKFSRMVRLSMPDIFSGPSVKVEEQQGPLYDVYRYDLVEALTLDQFRSIIGSDYRMHVLYVYEPSPVVFEGKRVCAMYDIHRGVMCRIYAVTNGDCQIRKVIVHAFNDLEEMTQALRAETAQIREAREERVLECVTRKQLMSWLL